MRLLQFKYNNKVSVGVEKTEGGEIIDLCAADPNIPNQMIDFIHKGNLLLESAQRILQKEKPPVTQRDKIKILAPINHCDKVLCVGLNYIDHVKELNYPISDLVKAPHIFNKFPSNIIGPNEGVRLNDKTKALDWEVEMAFVIGKQARNVEISKASDYIFGYTVALDVTARDCVVNDFNNGQWVLGKSMDTFCPLGPVLVTKDEIKDPQNLDIKCTVNGDIKQNSNTKNMIHTCNAILSYISEFLTLLPGDIILTGTPPGVGAYRKPPQFLQKGDIVECEINGIGKLINNIV